MVFETSINAIGLLANIATLATLTFNGSEFPWMTRILLQHQSMADIFICSAAIVMCIQPFMWMTHWNGTLDFLICQMWHGEAIYYFAVLISTWNLVFIAFERYMLIKNTHRYLNVKGKHIYAALFSMHVICLVFRIPGCLNTKYDEICGKCLAKYYYDTELAENFKSFYGIFWFGIAYAFPAAIFMMLYTKIITALRGRQQALEEINQRSHVFDSAEYQLTKSGLIVTAAFILFMTWDAWGYLFFTFGVIGKKSYEKKSWQSLLGAFLVAVNSCVNPFIYAGALPIFRKSLEKTFSFNTKKNRSKQASFLTLTKTKSNVDANPSNTIMNE